MLYACLGGAPQYLALVDSRLTLLENLEQLLLYKLPDLLAETR